MIVNEPWKLVIAYRWIIVQRFKTACVCLVVFAAAFSMPCIHIKHPKEYVSQKFKVN